MGEGVQITSMDTIENAFFLHSCLTQSLDPCCYTFEPQIMDEQSWY